LRSSGTDVVCGYQLLRCSYTILDFMWLYDEFFIILYNISKNCWVRLLSNYNIKYTCTIYTHLDTFLMFIARFFLRDKVTLRLLKLHFYWVDVVEWSRAIDIRLSDYFCSASMMWDQITSREEQYWTAQKSTSNTGLIFRRISDI
jgi:hypothetical protein